MRRMLAISILLTGLLAMAQAPQRDTPADPPGALVLWIVLPRPPATRGQADAIAKTVSPKNPFPGMPEQTSGSYGQTLAGFGTSLDGLPAAAAKANGTNPAQAKPEPPRHDREWDAFLGAGPGEWFPAGGVTTEDVPEDELEARLRDAGDKGPDVLLGAPLPYAWSRPDGGLRELFGLVTLGPTLFSAMAAGYEDNSKLWVQFSILAAARHPRKARDFVAWEMAGRRCWNCQVLTRAEQDLADVAVSALGAVLEGRSLGGLADREMGEFDPALAQLVALGGPGPRFTQDLETHVGVLTVRNNERFAVVQLAATVGNRVAFGAMQAVVVLRPDDSGKWHVLEISPALRGLWGEYAKRELEVYAIQVKAETVGIPLGISQASPRDGENRFARPVLWWDNKGGATLEVIESQSRAGGSWLSSNLLFVGDRENRARTETAAAFANLPGEYRWRIWSLAEGGAMTLSPWRTLRIVP